MKHIVLISLLSVALTGCAKESLYDYSQSHQADECKPYIHDSQEYDRCVAKTKKSYGDYKKEREELLNE